MAPVNPSRQVEHIGWMRALTFVGTARGHESKEGKCEENGFRQELLHRMR
jgi:hypothetical protein